MAFVLCAKLLLVTERIAHGLNFLAENVRVERDHPKVFCGRSFPVGRLPLRFIVQWMFGSERMYIENLVVDLRDPRSPHLRDGAPRDLRVVASDEEDEDFLVRVAFDKEFLQVFVNM